MRVPSSVSNLFFGSGASVSKRQRLTRSTSAPFRARQTPVSGRLSETTAEDAAALSRFPVAFRRASIGFLNRPAPAGELGLPHGRLTRTEGLDPDGIVTFHTAETRPGWVLSEPRGGGVLRGWLLVTSRRLPLRGGQPCPQPHIPPPGVSMTGHSSRVRACSPVRPSPCL
jgi:hypothetical protein